MCVVKTPKIKPTDAAAKTPDPAIIRSPFLDNAAEFATARRGRSSLRIDRGSGAASAPAPLPASAGAPTPNSAGGRIANALTSGSTLEKALAVFAANRL